jgi:hypothetical protein
VVLALAQSDGRDAQTGEAPIFETLEEHALPTLPVAPKITTFMTEGYSVLNGSVR